VRGAELPYVTHDDGEHHKRFDRAHPVPGRRHGYCFKRTVILAITLAAGHIRFALIDKTNNQKRGQTPPGTGKMRLMDSEREVAIRELLRDLGWFPSDLACDAKKRLAEEYLDATTAWLEAGKGLDRDLVDRLRQAYRGLWKSAPGPGEWERLRPAIDEARQKAVGARLDLEVHIAAHKC
jgi:hypothetical protein